LIELHFAVVISAFRLDLDKKICPESVESIWIIGAEPVTWIANDGDLVMDIEETTESIKTAVLVQLTESKSVISPRRLKLNTNPT